MTDRERALFEAEAAVEQVGRTWQPIRVSSGQLDQEQLHAWHVNVTRALKAIVKALQALGEEADDRAVDRLADALAQRLRQQMGGGQG